VEDEDEYSVEGEAANLFVECRARRECPMAQSNPSIWESGFKLDILEFQGCLQPEEFPDWVSVVDEILDFQEVPDDRRVPLVSTKFRGRAIAW
jgi:hypothetical protein